MLSLIMYHLRNIIRMPSRAYCHLATITMQWYHMMTAKRHILAWNHVF